VNGRGGSFPPTGVKKKGETDSLEPPADHVDLKREGEKPEMKEGLMAAARKRLHDSQSATLS